MVVDALKEAREAREAIQSLWTGLCRVFGFEESEDKYGVTIHTEVTLLENLPCRLSFKNISQTDQSGSFAATNQIGKLFIAPEVYVPPGSIIEVTQNSVTRKYKHSGISAIYTNHQEIILDHHDGRA